MMLGISDLGLDCVFQNGFLYAMTSSFVIFVFLLDFFKGWQRNSKGVRKETHCDIHCIMLIKVN